MPKATHTPTPVRTAPLRSQQRTFLVAAALSALLAVGACSKGDAAKAGAPAALPAPPTVGVVKVHLGTVGLVTELPGRLEAARSAQVRARATGVVQARLFTEGSEVKAGQPLFRMDNETYTAAAESARAQVLKAQTALAFATAKRKRYEPMAEKFIVSKQDYDVVVSAEQAAQADVSAAQAMLANARTNLSQTIITAPISGRIGRALVSEGALVSQNEPTPLALIQQTNPLYINFTQSASQAMQLRSQAQSAGAATPVEIVLDDGSVYSQAGRLLFTDSSVDPSTGQVQMRAEVPNAENILLPGLFVQVRIQQARIENAVRLPQQAVTRGAQANTVLVVNADGTFAPRSVEIAKGMGTDWIVTGGLAEGEQVLVNGQMKLFPGITKVQAVPYEELLEQERSAGAPAAKASAAKN